MYDRARETYGKLPGDPAARAALGRLEHNRSAVLRDLGRFQRIDRSQRAGAGDPGRDRPDRGNCALPAEPRHLLLHPRPATTTRSAYWAQSQTYFLQDGRSATPSWSASIPRHCLLQLRSFEEVLDACGEAVDLFARSRRVVLRGAGAAERGDRVRRRWATTTGAGRAWRRRGLFLLAEATRCGPR